MHTSITTLHLIRMSQRVHRYGGLTEQGAAEEPGLVELQNQLSAAVLHGTEQNITENLPRCIVRIDMQEIPQRRVGWE